MKTKLTILASIFTVLTVLLLTGAVPSPLYVGRFSGDAASLTNLPATSLTGTLGYSQLPGGVVTNNAATAINFNNALTVASGLTNGTYGGSWTGDVNGAHFAGAYGNQYSFDGNVGIGTTAPVTKLQVSGGDILLDNNHTFAFNNAAGAGRAGILWDSGDILNIGNFNLGGGTKGIAFLIDGRGTQVKIDANGNVGIGTMGPTATLSVAGTGITAPTITLTNAPTLMTTNAAPAGFVLGVSLPSVWFAVTNAGVKYLIPGFTP